MAALEFCEDECNLCERNLWDLEGEFPCAHCNGIIYGTALITYDGRYYHWGCSQQLVQERAEAAVEASAERRRAQQRAEAAIEASAERRRARRERRHHHAARWSAQRLHEHRRHGQRLAAAAAAAAASEPRSSNRAPGACVVSAPDAAEIATRTRSWPTRRSRTWSWPAALLLMLALVLDKGWSLVGGDSGTQAGDGLCSELLKGESWPRDFSTPLHPHDECALVPALVGRPSDFLIRFPIRATINANSKAPPAPASWCLRRILSDEISSWNGTPVDPPFRSPLQCCSTSHGASRASASRCHGARHATRARSDSWRLWSIRSLSAPRPARVSSASLFYLTHVRSCAASASGARTSASSPTASASLAEHMPPGAAGLCMVIRSMSGVLCWTGETFGRMPLHIMSCTVLAVGFPDLVDDAVMVAAALCADVHFDILGCRGVSSVAAWTLSAWLPPWIRGLFTLYCGICRPPFVLGAGTPVRGERSSNLSDACWATSTCGRLRSTEELNVAARNLHALMQAASTSVHDNGQSQGHSGLSQDLQGLDLAGASGTPMRRKSRSPRRLPDDCSRIRSSSTPPTRRAGSSGISMIMRLSTPPASPNIQSELSTATAVVQDSQESCFSFGHLATVEPALPEPLEAGMPACGPVPASNAAASNAATEAGSAGDGGDVSDAARGGSSVATRDEEQASELGDMLIATDAEPLAAGSAAPGALVSGDVCDLPAPGPQRRRLNENGAFAIRQGQADVELRGRFVAPPPDTPPMLRSAAIPCPFCSAYVCRGPARGLIRHLGSAHAGCTIHLGARRLLAALERGMCPEPQCCALRTLDSRTCTRCPSSRPARPLIEGDCIPTVSRIGRASGRRAEGAGPRWLDGAVLPADFAERIRALPSSTIVHIPLRFRETLCVITAHCLNAMCAGDASGSLLEESRSKLLLSMIPKGSNIRVELNNRLLLWLGRDFETLVLRIENQYRERRSATARNRVKSSVASRGRRAQQLALDGAYSKGVAATTTEVAQLSADEQKMWASRLLPRSSTPGDACFSGSLPLSTEQADQHNELRDNENGENVGEAAAAPRRSVPKHPLRGIRFPALSGAGPSGARPEHLKELVSVRCRPKANKLLAALTELRSKGQAGTLPACARWILDSHLVYLKKKHGPKPRPIRVGELWRRVIAKGLVHDHRHKIQQLMLRLRQYGVAIPGGADTLIHFRSACEEGIRRGSDEALIALDVDFENAFPSFEWSGIRDSVSAHMPSLSAWTAWCHREPSRVRLPCGETICVDRGAEQGDPLGPLQCALVLGDVADRARQAFQGGTDDHDPADQQALRMQYLDAWYMDDGQVFIQPALLDSYLRALDAEALRVGASRGTGESVKSVARLVGSEEAIACAPTNWATDYVRLTCKVHEPNSPTEVLGAIIAQDHAATEAHFLEASAKAAHTHSAIRLVEDTACELVLTRRCADVCKVTHLLRTGGDRVSPEALATFDASVRTAMDHIIGAPLSNASYLQATVSVQEGGLGLRRAADLALPAFIASSVESRPAVADLLEQFVVAGLLPTAALDSFDERLGAASARLWLSVPDSAAAALSSIMEEHGEMAEARFAAIKQGISENVGIASSVHQNSTALLLQPAGAEDPEHPSNFGGLQRRISDIMDALRVDELAENLLQAQCWSAVRRLSELRDPQVSHGWLWALNPAHGPRVRRDRFWTCLRIRLGIDIIGDATLCPRCSRHVLDTACAHALCCAPGESTRGHNRVRDSTLQLVHAADPSAETEVTGLIPEAPSLRPADIFTMAAIPGCQAALDIGICSPDACGAGADCCESMFQSKMGTYREHLDGLASRNVRYKPLIFSCFGRPHPESHDTLEGIAKQAARRHGVADHRPILKRALDHISVQIWSRAAAMVHACVPESTPEELALLFGDGDVDDENVDDENVEENESMAQDEEPDIAESMAQDEEPDIASEQAEAPFLERS